MEPTLEAPFPEQNENHAPQDISLDSATVAENARGGVIGNITIVDPDASDTHRFDISGDRFEFVDSQLKLKPGIALIHEDAAQIEVDVTVTDAKGASLSERVTVDVQDVNETPEAISLDSASVAENAQGAIIGNITIADPDASDTHKFDISDDRFEVVDGKLKLKPGIALNHEDAAQIDVDVTVTDAEGASLSERFTVNVQDVNEGPSRLAMQYDADNLVRNGSFEEFDLEKGKWKGFDADKTGSWKDTNGMEIWDQLGGTKASDGDQLLEMDHDRGIDSISQIINTEDGQLYDLSVDLRERLAGGTDTVEVYWNGNLIAELDPQSADWETFQLKVVGTGQDTLELREADGENDTYGALVDNITLTAAEQTVAENVEGAVVGQISFDEPDLSDSHRFEVSDDRFVVVDNQLRLKPGVALDFEGASSITVDVTVVDEGGLSQTESFTVKVEDMDEITFSSGFHAKFFEVDHRLSKLDDIDWNAESAHQEVTSDVNFSNGHESFWEGGSKDTFGVQITGNVEVEEGGTFTFFLGADDGAILVINGEPVVENDGVHGFRTRSGKIELEPGTHSIEIRYFENYGRAGLKLEWEGPGLDGRELVTAPDSSAAQTVAGMPLAFEVDLGALKPTDETRFELGDLPEGTIVDTGGVTYAADTEGSIELAGWRGEMLTITPPSDYSGTVEASLRHSTPTGENSSHDAVQKLAFEVNEAALSAIDAKMVGGFHASYFDADNRLSKLDDLNWNGTPTHQEFVPEINYKNSADSFWEGGSKDTFGAKLEGRITIEEGGSYTFFAGGDDGVAVFINGVEIIDNDGLHGFRTRSGQIDLEPGCYDIEVRYFENYGHAGLKLEWDGPDSNGRELLQPDPGTTIGENGTFEVGLELDNAGDQAVVSLDGFPAGTLFISGEDAVMADGGPTDLSGWSLDFLEISPPPGFEGLIEGEIIVTDTGFNGAQVTSESPFVLEVGQTDHGTPDISRDLAETLSATTGPETHTPWNMDHLQSENEDADVMAEAVLTNPGSEISCIETEAYERIDW
ncbi:PA14 domain-containing protein [Ruegeria sp. Ofav3-42]|uniref:PA14 domain-containing protein n=1 Tax=Ruegeria sp. Ofav3-42 TaxID=2917759 RepID=UPI001EF50C1D|nr:PA14 domain-containing protein [Ruegeria sp. Ofav3-42]MCG7522173.1 PA14 domain-containing protein [Ruegeria sp. Ofav3-42]